MRAGDFGIGLEDDLVFRRDDDVGSEELTGGAGVVGNHEIGVGAQGPVGSEAQRAGAERGEDPSIRGHPAGVELVEVVDHGRVRLVGRS